MKKPGGVTGPLGRRLIPGPTGDHIALAFAVGPHPRATPLILETLHRYAVAATFFLDGPMASDHRTLAQQIAADGHEVAVHGSDRELLLYRGPRAVHDDLARTVELITEASGQCPLWYRPPYGVLTPPALQAARALGLTPVLWNGWDADWTAHATAESVLRTAVLNLRAGSTILLQDSDRYAFPGSWRSSAQALPQLIALVRRRGLPLGPLHEHLALQVAPLHQPPTEKQRAKTPQAQDT
jgi:peptidoglycan/xylan/chitin deacetylase (PgdA/CDA1 family)